MGRIKPLEKSEVSGEALVIYEEITQTFAAHSAALKRLGVPKAKVMALLGELGRAGLSEKERALLEFTRTASVDPHKVTERDVSRLRDLFPDTELVEALGVMEVFTSFNKFLDCLDVDMDF